MDLYKTTQKETPRFITSSIVTLLLCFSWCCVLEYMVCFEILTEVGEVSTKQNILIQLVVAHLRTSTSLPLLLSVSLLFYFDLYSLLSV